MNGPANLSIATPSQTYIQRTKYRSTLLLYFIVSLGFCCAVFSILPSHHSHSSGDNQSKDIAYITIRLIISIILLLFCTFVARHVRNRAKFHENQEVYWPFECSHCAEAVGLASNASRRECEPSRVLLSASSDRVGDQEGSTSNSITNASHTTNDNGMDESGQRCLQTLPTSYFDDTTIQLENLKTNRLNEPFYKQPHKSLLRVYNMFGILALINLPIQFLTVISCLTLTDGFGLTNVTLFTKFVFEMSVFITLASSLFFFNIYYEAVFIDVTRFSYAFVVFFATAIWMFNNVASVPIAIILDTYYDPLEHCEVDYKFKKFILDQEKQLTKFYAECCVVFAAIVWQMWSSILPRSSIDSRSNSLLSNNQHVLQNISYCSKVKSWVRRIREKITVFRDDRTNERQYILVDQGTSRKMRLFRNICLIILLVSSVLYCTGQFTLYANSFDFTSSTLTYLQWSLEISYSIPLLGLLHYQSFILNRSKRTPVKPGVSGLLEGHDRLLLLSCGGIFAISIFRLIGAIEMFTQVSSVGTDDIVLASYAAIYSIFRIYLFWSMTSFLLLVQRRMVQSLLETKLVLVCLLYTVALNAANWLISIAEVHACIELQSYYGSKLGEVMGGLFEPFESLYGLHAAIVAYETYQNPSFR